VSHVPCPVFDRRVIRVRITADYRNPRETRDGGAERREPRAPVQQPIFLIGCGRSGTTLLYDILCGQPGLAWFSNYTDRWPGLPQLAVLSRLYAPMRRRELSLPRAPLPSEGYRIFDYYSARSAADNNRPLDGSDANPMERLALRRVIAAHLRFGGGSRFINKNTRNTRRVPFLHQMFPDARFIHVIRDPRATASSLLRVAFWPALRFWWRDNRTATELPDVDAETLAGELWAHEVRAGLQQGLLGDSAYMEVRYEDLVAAPREQVSAVLKFVGLEWTPSFESVFDSFAIEDRTSKFRSSLNDYQLQLIAKATQPLAQELGYLSDQPW